MNDPIFFDGFHFSTTVPKYMQQPLGKDLPPRYDLMMADLIIFSICGYVVYRCADAIKKMDKEN